MTRKLQFLLTALLLMVGVTSAWGKIIFPNALIQYRTTNAISAETASTNSWKDGNFPKDGKKINKVEASGTNYMWFIAEYIVPDMENVTSISLPMSYNGTAKDVNVYLWTNTYPGVKADYDVTFVGNVVSKIATAAFATITSSSSTVTISDTNLNTLKNTFGSSGSVTVKFLFYIKTSSEGTAFWGGKPNDPTKNVYMNITYSTSGPLFSKNNTAFSTTPTTLNAAVSDANTADGDVITINDDVFLTSRLDINKSLTFKPASGKDIHIYMWHDNSTSMIISTADSKTITFDGSEDGASLTIDYLSKGRTHPIYGAEKNSGTTTFKNVIFKNGNNKVIDLKSGKSEVVILDGVSFINCPTAESADGVINASTSYLRLKGQLTFTECGTNIYLDSDKDFVCENLSDPTNPISILLGNNFSNAHKLSKNGAIRQFSLRNNRWYMVKDGDFIYVYNSYSLSIGTEKMATLTLPFNVTTLPEGVKAYNLTSTTTTVTASPVTSITKDKPVLIVSDNNNGGTFAFSPDDEAISYSIDNTPSNGALTGAYKQTVVASGYYTLNKKGDVVGFYKSDGSKKVKAFRAYLKKEIGSLAPEMFNINFDDNNITGIASIILEEETPIYNLQGVRMKNNSLPKGIYVKNGKKFIVK